MDANKIPYHTARRRRLREEGKRELTIIVPISATDGIRHLARLLCYGSRFECATPGEVINLG